MTARLLTVIGEFDVDAQMGLSRAVLEKLGFEDGVTGRVDLSAHPFSTSFSPHDLRITTRVRTDEWYQGLAGTIHEFGHSLYEGQVRDSGLPVDAALSMGTHESQSIFWERHVGLSRPFFSLLGPMLRDHLGVSGSDDELHAACNAIGAGPIRVEADELAYPLHVILRYEIERQVIEGAMTVDEIPEAWDRRMQGELPLPSHRACVSTRRRVESCCLPLALWVRDVGGGSAGQRRGLHAGSPTPPLFPSLPPSHLP